MMRPALTPQGHLLIHDTDGQPRGVPIDRDLTLGSAAGPTRAGSPDPLGAGDPRGHHVAIAGSGLMSRHALVTREDGVHYVQDVSGSCGTRVNGRPVRRKALIPGDIITLGESPVRIEFTLKAAQAARGDDAAGDSRRRTRVLLDLLAVLHAARAPREIWATAAGIVVKAIGAQWALLAIEEAPGKLRVAGAADTCGALPDEPTGHAARVMAGGRSIFLPGRICVPVESRHGRIGVLEVGPRPEARYTAHDLELAEALADHVGVAIANARGLEAQPRYLAAGAS